MVFQAVENGKRLRCFSSSSGAEVASLLRVHSALRRIQPKDLRREDFKYNFSKSLKLGHKIYQLGSTADSAQVV